MHLSPLYHCLLLSFVYLGNPFALAFLTKLLGVCFVYCFYLLGDWNLGDRTVEIISITESIFCALGPWIWGHLHDSLFTLTVLAAIQEIIVSDCQETGIAT